jgi:hypothetical protein
MTPPADDQLAYLAQVGQPRTRMAGIDLRPAWVGALDFASRLARALGGINKATE